MHGIDQTPESFRASVSWEPVADSNYFVVAYPAGLMDQWNAGHLTAFDELVLDVPWGPLTSKADLRRTNDVAFIRSLVDYLVKYNCVDRQRVYATGFSSGAFMAHRLLCEASDMIAAVVSSEGVLADRLYTDQNDNFVEYFSCDGTSMYRPLPIMHWHGSNDRTVTTEGMVTMGNISKKVYVNFGILSMWAQLKGIEFFQGDPIGVRVRTINSTLDFWGRLNIECNEIISQSQTLITSGSSTSATVIKYRCNKTDEHVQYYLLNGTGYQVFRP